MVDLEQRSTPSSGTSRAPVRRGRAPPGSRSGPSPAATPRHAARVRPRASRRRPAARARPVAPGLLEVVADDLVELDELRAVSSSQLGEPLVQLGARRLRQRVVRGVADQQVAEAEGVVAGELARVGADELLADEREQPLRRPAAPRARAPRRRRGGRPCPRRRRARAPRARRARAGRGARRAAPGSSAARRPRRRPSPATSASISSTNSGLPSAASRMRARRPASTRRELLDQLVRLRRARAARAGRSSRSACRRAQPARRSSSSGRAMQSSRIGAPAAPVGDVLDEVEERRLGPVQVVPDDDERPLVRGLLERLAHRPRDLVGRRPARRTRRAPPRPPPRRARRRAASRAPVSTSTTGQSVIPSP